MRLLIIGLDGLDARYVERWSLRGLQQAHWGQHYVGFLKKLYTPILWSCFLTGLNVEEHGYDLERLRYKRGEDALPPSVRPFYALRKRLLPGHVKLGIRWFLAKLRVVKRCPPSNMPPGLRRRSFLNALEARGLRVHAIEVPGYNERWNEYFRTAWSRFLSAPLTDRLRMIGYCIRECERRVSLAVRALSGRRRPDVLMVYFPMPDIAHHLLLKGIRAIRELHRAYWLAERWVETIKEMAGPDYACLIVSDHGFERAEKTHSDHGFWSLNVEPPFRPERITDFYRLVMELVSRP
mgnify:CR=1 FL=1